MKLLTYTTIVLIVACVLSVDVQPVSPAKPAVASIVLPGQIKPAYSCDCKSLDRYNVLLKIVQDPASPKLLLQQAYREMHYILEYCLGLTCPLDPKKAIAELKKQMMVTKYTAEGLAEVLRRLAFLERICLRIKHAEESSSSSYPACKPFSCPCDVPARIRELNKLIKINKSGCKGKIRCYRNEKRWIKKHCLYNQFHCRNNPLLRIKKLLEGTRSCTPLELKQRHCAVKWMKVHCFKKPDCKCPKPLLP